MNQEKLISIDPPSGWKYGFPKTVTESEFSEIDNLKEWCIEQGYPAAEADSFGEYFLVITTEME
jgi:hypothetical protein